jgi:hypothetical protein
MTRTRYTAHRIAEATIGCELALPNLEPLVDT